MYRTCRRLVLNGDVDGFVSFNPFPYGVIPLLACRDQPDIAVHWGFIGSDWYGCRQRVIRLILKPLWGRCDLITVPGVRMKQEVETAGFDDSKIRIMPHGINLAEYPLNDPGQCRFDLLAVGSLVQTKRIDLLLDTVAAMVRNQPHIQVGIVGDGPLRPELEAQCKRLSLCDHVTFIGHVDDVSSHLLVSRIFVLTSDSEGLPFALVEAMASGLIPVCTDVGTIGDMIRTGENGFLVRRGGRDELTDTLNQLLNDRNLQSQIRNTIVSERSKFGISNATAVWTEWLQGLYTKDFQS